MPYGAAKKTIQIGGRNCRAVHTGWSAAGESRPVRTDADTPGPARESFSSRCRTAPRRKRFRSEVEIVARSIQVGRQQVNRVQSVLMPIHLALHENRFLPAAVRRREEIDSDRRSKLSRGPYRLVGSR